MPGFLQEFLDSQGRYDLIGWISSLILLATIGKQIRKQWAEHSSRGVSKWLYLGQFAAEAGFILYSYLLRNWVFLATNSLLLIENLVGLGVTLRHRQLARRSAEAEDSCALN